MLATMVEHVIGIDPDRDRVTASVVDTATTGEQASGVFEASRVGYDRLLGWADRHTGAGGRVWSVEGTGSYGSGVAGFLVARGEWVVEFGDPTPTRDGAKSDALDARRAARQVLGRERLPVPRARGNREALRVLETTRRGAQVARVAAINELKALVVTAPVDLRTNSGPSPPQPWSPNAKDSGSDPEPSASTPPPRQPCDPQPDVSPPSPPR